MASLFPIVDTSASLGTPTKDSQIVLVKKDVRQALTPKKTPASLQKKDKFQRDSPKAVLELNSLIRNFGRLSSSEHLLSSQKYTHSILPEDVLFSTVTPTREWGGPSALRKSGGKLKSGAKLNFGLDTVGCGRVRMLAEAASEADAGFAGNDAGFAGNSSPVHTPGSLFGCDSLEGRGRCGDVEDDADLAQEELRELSFLWSESTHTPAKSVASAAVHKTPHSCVRKGRGGDLSSGLLAAEEDALRTSADALDGAQYLREIAALSSLAQERERRARLEQEQHSRENRKLLDALHAAEAALAAQQSARELGAKEAAALRDDTPREVELTKQLAEMTKARDELSQVLALTAAELNNHELSSKERAQWSKVSRERAAEELTKVTNALAEMTIELAETAEECSKVSNARAAEAVEYVAAAARMQELEGSMAAAEASAQQQELLIAFLRKSLADVSKAQEQHTSTQRSRRSSIGCSLEELHAAHSSLLQHSKMLEGKLAMTEQQLTFAQQREQAAAEAKAAHARSAHDTKLALAAEREVLAARDTILLDLRAQIAALGGALEEASAARDDFSARAQAADALARLSEARLKEASEAQAAAAFSYAKQTETLVAVAESAEKRLQEEQAALQDLTAEFARLQTQAHASEAELHVQRSESARELANLRAQLEALALSAPVLAAADAAAAAAAAASPLPPPRANSSHEFAAAEEERVALRAAAARAEEERVAAAEAARAREETLEAHARALERVAESSAAEAERSGELVRELREQVEHSKAQAARTGEVCRELEERVAAEARARELDRTRHRQQQLELRLHHELAVREQQAEAEVLLARIGCLERELGESAEDVEELEAALSELEAELLQQQQQQQQQQEGVHASSSSTTPAAGAVAGSVAGTPNTSRLEALRSRQRARASATPRAGGGARAPVRIPVRFTPSSARHSRPPTPQMPTSSGRPVTPAGGFLRRKSHAGAAAAAAEEWPLWLRSAATMWADARDSCLPHVSVAATEEAAGITYYRLRVRQHADARTEWQVVHRFSAFCSLHSELLKQVPAYHLRPPPAAQALLVEKKEACGWIGRSASVRQATLKRRTLILSNYLAVLVSTVEVLAAPALAAFLDLREQLMDRSRLAQLGFEASCHTLQAAAGAQDILSWDVKGVGTSFPSNVLPSVGENWFSRAAGPGGRRETRGGEAGREEREEEEGRAASAAVGGGGGATGATSQLACSKRRASLASACPALLPTDAALLPADATLGATQHVLSHGSSASRLLASAGPPFPPPAAATGEPVARRAKRVRHECATDESPEDLRDVTDVSAVLSVTVSSPSVCDVGGVQMLAPQFRVRDDSLGPQIHDDSLLADISASSTLASARSAEAGANKGVSSARSPADALDAVADADTNTRVSSSVVSSVTSSGTEQLMSPGTKVKSKVVRPPVAASTRTCLKDISTTHQLRANKNSSPVTVTHGLGTAKGELSGKPRPNDTQAEPERVSHRVPKAPNYTDPAFAACALFPENSPGSQLRFNF